MENRTELGSIQVHKNALAEIINSAINEMEGVRLSGNNFGSRLLSMLGEKSYPGIKIEFDGEGNASIGIKVSLRYGMNLPEAAKAVQLLVKNALSKSADINLKEVNVNIHSIDRG